MNAIVRPGRSVLTDPAAFMAEQLGFVVLHANMAQAYIEAGDAAGLNYALKNITARVRCIVGIANDMTPEEAGDEAHG